MSLLRDWGGRCGKIKSVSYRNKCSRKQNVGALLLFKRFQIPGLLRSTLGTQAVRYSCCVDGPTSSSQLSNTSELLLGARGRVLRWRTKQSCTQIAPREHQLCSTRNQKRSRTAALSNSRVSPPSHLACHCTTGRTPMTP